MVAPGSLITIYGDGLDGAKLLLGNQVLSAIYSSNGQVNAQVPFEVDVNASLQLIVRNGDALSVPEDVGVAEAQPAVFTQNQQGTGQGVILKSDQVTLAQPGAPAEGGETVVIYCTGLGAVNPAVATGQPAPSQTLARTASPVTVTVGGAPANVVFAGLAPGFIGLYQINATLDKSTPSGDAVPVIVSVAGQTSPTVTMAVR